MASLSRPPAHVGLLLFVAAPPRSRPPWFSGPRLYDVVHTERKLTLVFEYLDQDLKKYLDVCEGGLESNILKSFLYQLLRGVAYCHHHRV